MQRFTLLTSGLAGGEANTVLYSAGEGSIAAQGFADLLNGVWSDLAAAFSTSVTITLDPLVAQVTPADNVTENFFPVTFEAVTGTNSAEILPANVSPLVQFSTAGVRRGRRVAGRTFLAGLTEAAFFNGRLETASTTPAIVDAFTSLVDNGSLSLVVYSRPAPARAATPTRPARPAAPGVATPVTAVSAWQYAAQQGRRRR